MYAEQKSILLRGSPRCASLYYDTNVVVDGRAASDALVGTSLRSVVFVTSRLIKPERLGKSSQMSHR